MSSSFFFPFLPATKKRLQKEAFCRRADGKSLSRSAAADIFCVPSAACGETEPASVFPPLPCWTGEERKQATDVRFKSLRSCIWENHRHHVYYHIILQLFIQPFISLLVYICIFLFIILKKTMPKRKQHTEKHIAFHIQLKIAPEKGKNAETNKEYGKNEKRLTGET